MVNDAKKGFASFIFDLISNDVILVETKIWFFLFEVKKLIKKRFTNYFFKKFSFNLKIMHNISDKCIKMV